MKERILTRCEIGEMPIILFKFFYKFRLFFFFSLILTSPLFAQKVSVIVPAKTELSQKFAENLENSLSGKVKILDNSLSETAFRSVPLENVFNLTTIESKNVGAVIGCDFFLLIKAESQRRASLSKNDYHESFAAIYAVSSRTGKLIFWKLQSFEAEKQGDAEKLLLASAERLSFEISEKLKVVSGQEIAEKAAAKIEGIPDDASTDAKNFRPPLPFKRIIPEYTRLAYLYEVAATVDIELDIDETGEILRTEIVRWAGFGLDESVTEAVRKMNWRAAERNGKTLPMRILLRYNFKERGK